MRRYTTTTAPTVKARAVVVFLIGVVSPFLQRVIPGRTVSNGIGGIPQHVISVLVLLEKHVLLCHSHNCVHAGIIALIGVEYHTSLICLFYHQVDAVCAVYMDFPVINMLADDLPQTLDTGQVEFSKLQVTHGGVGVQLVVKIRHIHKEAVRQDFKRILGDVRGVGPSPRSGSCRKHKLVT